MKRCNVLGVVALKQTNTIVFNMQDNILEKNNINIWCNWYISKMLFLIIRIYLLILNHILYILIRKLSNKNYKKKYLQLLYMFG